MKMKWFLIVIIGLLVLVSMTGVTYVSISAQKAAIIDQVATKTVSTGQSYASTLQNMENMMAQQMVSAALYIKELDQQKVLSQADLVEASQKTGMTLADVLDGQSYWQNSTDSANLNKNLSLFSLNPAYPKQYEALFAGTKPIDIGPIILRSQDGKVVKFVKVFRGPGQGIIQVGLEAEAFEEVQKSIVKEDSSIRNVTLLNSTGLVLTTAEPTDKSSGLFEKGKPVEDEWLKEQIKKGETNYRMIDLPNGEPGLQVIASVKNENKLSYLTVVTVSLQSIYSDLANLQWRMITLAGGVTLAILIVLFFFLTRFTKQIVKPVEEITGILENMAQNGGDLTQEVNVKSYPEINRLGEAQNKLIQSIRNLVLDIRGLAEELFTSSQQLAVGAQQSASASTSVANSISDVSAGTEKQQSLCNNVNQAVDQMDSSINVVAKNTVTVEEMTDRTSRTLELGNQAIITAMEQMNNLETFISSSAELVKELGQRSQEIGQFVDSISSIAGQTNLLALNAAIESARAGEHGRGFAVVADEVRKLAEESNEAAKRIAEVIIQIQKDTGAAISVMNQGAEEVIQGNKAVHLSGKAFEESSQEIRKVRDEVKEMSSAIHQMAQYSKNFVNNIHEINTASDNIVDQTQSVTAATEEQSALMQEIAASSQGVNDIAEYLTKMVEKFKV